MKWTKRDITKLKKLWKEGLTGKEIASKMKRSTGSVVMKIHALQKSGELLYRHKGKNESKKTQKEWKGYSPLEIKTLKDAYKYVDDVTKEATTKVVVHTATNPSDVLKAAGSKGLTNTQRKIENECRAIMHFLLKKNEAYGDSAIAPIRIFSQSDAQEQLKVRIDDKLNRLMQGNSTIETDEDVIKDLIGYLILLLVQMKE